MPDQLLDSRLRAFARRVAESPHNLVSRGDRGRLLDRHIPESVALAEWLPGGPRLLDIGSGGGFPGVVIAVLRPDLEVHLLDATRKKTEFLHAVVEELGLSVTVHTGRAEVLASSELGEGFDLVTARAVAPLSDLVPLALPFLRPGGRLFAIKGSRWAEELERAQRALSAHMGEVVEVPDEGQRNQDPSRPRVVVIEKQQDGRKCIVRTD